MSNSEMNQMEVLRLLDQFPSSISLATIVQSTKGDMSARSLTSALGQLLKFGLVIQDVGGMAWYRISDAGRIKVKEAQEDDFLMQVTPHPGGEALDLLTGALAVGVRRDGSQYHWQLWNEIGAVPAVAIGGSGSGTTNLLAGVIEAAQPHSRQIRTWLIDDGRQMTEYWDKVERVSVIRRDQDDRRRNLKPAYEMLDDVLRAVMDRNKVLADRRERSWTGPLDSHKMPLGLLVISSLPDLVQDHGLKQKLSQILRMARGAGVSVVADVPDATIQSFGGDMKIRNAFGAGNLLLFRIGARPIGDILGDTLIEQPDLPRTFHDGSTTAGLAYTASSEKIRAYWASGL